MSEGNGLATREALLANTARRFAEYPLPNGVVVRVRSLTELERQRWEQETISTKGTLSKPKMLTANCRLIILCAVDNEGNALFADSDVDALQRQDSLITNALADACQQHCGISKSDLEGLEKNSLKTTDDDSLST